MRRTPARAPEHFVQEESKRVNRTWQVFCDKTIRRSQYAKPFLLSGVTEECLCAHLWTSWSVAVFPRQSSLYPWSALAYGNTWVAGAGFPRKFIRWEWVGPSEGENPKVSSCGTRSWATVCRGLDHRWSCCRWSSVASSDKSVVLGGCAEGGRQLWTDWKDVGGNRANRWDGQYWSSVDTWRGFGKFRKFPESFRLIADSHCCFAFSQSSLLECCPKFCLAWLVGLRFTNFVALNSRSVVWLCEPSCALGEGHFSSGCRGRYRSVLHWCHIRIVSARVGCGCCGWFGVPRCSFSWVACVGRHLRQKFGKWVQPEVSRVPSVRSASLWIPSWWQSSLSRVWRGLSIATGWCHVPVFVMPSSQESCRYRQWLTLSTTSCECDLSSLSTSRRLVERRTATA